MPWCRARVGVELPVQDLRHQMRGHAAQILVGRWG